MLKYAARYSILALLFVGLVAVGIAIQAHGSVWMALWIAIAISPIGGLASLLNLTAKRKIEITEQGLSISERLISIEKRQIPFANMTGHQIGQFDIEGEKHFFLGVECGEGDKKWSETFVMSSDVDSSCVGNVFETKDVPKTEGFAVKIAD